jgi:maleylpyruvate isomerase
MKLYDFFRSGTSHRLRIALNLKGVDYDQVPIDLRSNEHLTADYSRVNPQRLVPALVTDNQVLTQTPAIIEWLEERFPQPAFLPTDAGARVHVRALAALIACDIHPLNNRRALEYLRSTFRAQEPQINAWCATWINAGFDAYEALLSRHGQRSIFSHGDAPGLADIYLIPQIESARRFGVNMERWARLLEIESACLRLDAFSRARPAAQPGVAL